MGNILSSNTIYATAYLTELGRKLLFAPAANHRFSTDTSGNIIDKFTIVSFSMSDPDFNYKLSEGVTLETGDIANVSGKNEDCIKGTVVNKESNLISVNGQIVIDNGGGVGNGTNPTSTPPVDVPYTLETDLANNIASSDISTFPIGQ